MIWLHAYFYLQEIRSSDRTCELEAEEDLCWHCNKELIQEPSASSSFSSSSSSSFGVYCFPCGHNAHISCALTHLSDKYPPAVLPRVRQILASLEDLNTSVKSTPFLSFTPKQAMQRDILEAELDGLLGAECMLCGEYAISCLDMPLLPLNGVNRDSSWDL